MRLVPQPWEFALLALGAFRLSRLVGWDSITEKLRTRVTGYRDEDAPELSNEADARRFPAWRVYVSTLIRCPWCQGFYVSVTVWAAWVGAARWTLAVCAPLAVSATVGLIAKNLDP